MVSPQELKVTIPIKCNVCGFLWLSNEIFGCPECGSFNIAAIGGKEIE
jgi:predicted Zn-ribbon and HTH transcriptional regulator